MMDWLAASADSLVGQAPAVAAELLAQAVGSIPAGSGKHGWLAGRLADALYRTGDRAAAVRVAERALGHAVDPDLVVDLHWTLAQCRMLAGTGAESLTTLDRALASPTLSAKHRARLLVLAARTYLYLGELEAADREADGALASAQEVDDAWATGWALHVLAIGATIRCDLTDALPLYDRGLAVAETDPGLTDLGLLLLINKAATLFNLDRHDEALTTAERARQLADQVGTARPDRPGARHPQPAVLRDRPMGRRAGRDRNHAGRPKRAGRGQRRTRHNRHDQIPPERARGGARIPVRRRAARRSRRSSSPSRR